ncbi:hypothetical protein SRABI106_04481 [Rahnella aquatilis]|nr:hypothetical protein SRABI106_04481 [Rahnella aquatilis]
MNAGLQQGLLVTGKVSPRVPGQRVGRRRKFFRVQGIQGREDQHKTVNRFSLFCVFVGQQQFTNGADFITRRRCGGGGRFFLRDSSGDNRSGHWYGRSGLTGSKLQHTA